MEVAVLALAGSGTAFATGWAPCPYRGLESTPPRSVPPCGA